MNYHSQFQEDQWIQENLNPPDTAEFVEVGAFDGIQSSNTLYFEEKGWTGLCIEPDPEIAAMCVKNRKAKTLCCAVGFATEGSVWSFTVNDQDRGTSGLYRPGNRFILVPVMRLDAICINLGLRPWLLSIDTEGSEGEVWQSFRRIKDKERPQVVVMEYLTLPDPPRDKELTQMMAHDGYKVAHQTEANLIFTR